MTSQNDKIEFHLRFLLDPFGDAPHLRQRELSVEYLLAHADQAYPRLLQALRANPLALNAPAIIEVLPRFGRADSVPILAQIMEAGAEQVSGVAGQALGRHPDPSAKTALLRGLQAQSPETVAAAADGLMVRGDRTVCVHLKAHFGHSSQVARYHVIQAAFKLGCLDSAEVGELKKADSGLRGILE
ncbi:MAG TPA: HEAT repeat domain-containing protein [Candidatus Binatia bacterium]|nr:HEAT repeat domain-containing protein [Candidatus Binatia bacterium]